MLMLDPGAQDELDHLHAVNPVVAARVEDWLDRLEGDHTQAAVRLHRMHVPALWRIIVRAPDGDDYMILWELEGADVIVRIIGPDILS